MEHDETDKAGERATAGAADAPQPEWRTADPLLNAPGRLARLVETVFLLSAVTGVLYAWGLSYYGAFSEALGLSRSHFAFQVQPQEAVVAGAYVLVFFIGGAPIVFWSVAVALMAVVAVVALSHFVASLLREWWRKLFSKFMARRHGRKKTARRLASFRFSPETERAFERIGRAAEGYFFFGVLLFLLMMLLRWGDAEASRLGAEVANRQLAACPRVEVTFGENQKVDSSLCGRIGGDYILRAPQNQQGPQDKYVIVKEATVRQIIVH